MIKSYWVLDKEKSKEFKEVVEAKADANIKARDFVLGSVDCDEVFISRHDRIYLGYKEKKEREQLYKKPTDYIDGHYLYAARAKSKILEVVVSAEKSAKEVISFPDYCKQKFKGTSKSILGDKRGSGFALYETSFGFYSDQVVMMMPFADGDVDLSIIPDGFTQITEIELSELRRAS